MKEAIVGKYIVGALASLLIFIGAISLVILLWDKVTPQLNVILMFVTNISLALLISGYKCLSRKHQLINLALSLLS